MSSSVALSGEPKPPIKREIMTYLVTEMAGASSTQATDTAKEPLALMVARGLDSYSDAELFDALVAFSALPETEISRFCIAACALDRYYAQPSLRVSKDGG